MKQSPTSFKCLILFFFLTIVSFQKGMGQCSFSDPQKQLEYDALIAFYNANPGNTLNNLNNGWLSLLDGSNCNVCDLVGITCAAAGYITKITFFSNRQISVLPSEIGNLTNLVELTISSNQINSIPVEIGNLTNLVKLNLLSNQLTSLPIEIGNLSSLTNLQVPSNQLTSLPPEIGNLTNLTNLNVGFNQLSDLPAEIGNLSGLVTLRAYNNQLTALPSGLGFLQNLSQLYLYNNQFSSLPPEIGNLTSLTLLDAKSNFLTELPSEIENLVNLTTLAISNNSFTSLDSELWNLNSLNSFSAADNQLTTLPTAIENLMNLTILFIPGNQITTLPDEIGNLTNLSYVSFKDNQINCLSAELGNLCDVNIPDGFNGNPINDLITLDEFCANPQDICVGDNPCLFTFTDSQKQLEYEALVAFYNTNPGNTLESEWEDLAAGTICDVCVLPGVTCTNGYITNLSLTEKQLSTVPAEIGNLNLTGLYLSKNQLSSIPPEIWNLTTLNVLYVDRNQISSIPPEIGNLSSLQALSFSDNQISTIPPEIGNLVSLIDLSFTFNQVNVLPPEIGNLASLRVLDLWENQLSILPPEIGNLMSLKELILPANQLNSLPSEIGNLSILTTLILQDNQLTEIPITIGNLNDLRHLNVIENQLTSLPVEIGNLTSLFIASFKDNQISCLSAELGNLCDVNNSDVFDSNPINDLITLDEFCANPQDICIDEDGDGFAFNEDCEDNNPTIPTTAGTPCDDNNDNTSNDMIQADGCTCEGAPSDCSIININSSGDQLIVSGLSGSLVTKVQILNSTWTPIFDCFGNCSETESVTVTNGDYFVRAGLYDSSWTLICEVEEWIEVDNTSSPCMDFGGDNDNDGVCANDDCDDNNPTVPAAVGSTCDDGNSETENDVIQADGCTCEGIVIGSPDCGSINIAVANNLLTVSGLDGAPVSKLYVFDVNWNTVFSCFGDCEETETLQLANGFYRVRSSLYGADWQQICALEEDITIVGDQPCNDQGGDSDGDGICDDLDNCPDQYNPLQTDQNSNGIGDDCETPNDPCTELEAVASNGIVSILGLESADIGKVQIFDSNWQNVYTCFGDCDPSPSVFVDDGLYYVRLGIYDASWQNICDQLFNLTVSDGSGTAMMNGFGTEENDAFDFNLFPNPANEYIRLSIPKKEEGQIVAISVYNSLGIQMYQNEEVVISAAPVVVDVSQYGPGVYTCVLSSEKYKRVSRRFVVCKL